MLSNRSAHPTAKAFFDALDQHNREQEGCCQENDNGKEDGTAITKTTATVLGKPFMSESLKRKSQSLGWRNRNSQNEYYPITILQSTAVPGSKEDTDCQPAQRQSSPRLRRRKFSVQQIQRGEVEGTYGTGATVWPAAMVLIKYLERINNFNINRNAGDEYMDRNPVVTLRGKHVVDLGSGTGVTSIAAALLGANSVTCTDGEEPVVRLARDNILRASNQLSESISSEETLSSTADGDENNTVTIDACPIRAQKFWWGTEFSPTLKSGSQDNGIAILVADCVLPKLYPIAPLVQAIDDCLRLHHDDEEKYQEATESQARSSSFAIVSYEHRYYPEYDPRIEFRRLASERCLDVFTVPRDEMDPVYSLDDVEIWIVRRKSVQCSKK